MSLNLLESLKLEIKRQTFSKIHESSAHMELAASLSPLRYPAVNSKHSATFRRKTVLTRKFSKGGNNHCDIICLGQQITMAFFLFEWNMSCGSCEGKSQNLNVIFPCFRRKLMAVKKDRTAHNQTKSNAVNVRLSPAMMSELTSATSYVFFQDFCAE